MKCGIFDACLILMLASARARGQYVASDQPEGSSGVKGKPHEEFGALRGRVGRVQTFLSDHTDTDAGGTASESLYNDPRQEEESCNLLSNNCASGLTCVTWGEPALPEYALPICVPFNECVVNALSVIWKSISPGYSGVIDGLKEITSDTLSSEPANTSDEQKAKSVADAVGETFASLGQTIDIAYLMSEVEKCYKSDGEEINRKLSDYNKITNNVLTIGISMSMDGGYYYGGSISVGIAIEHGDACLPDCLRIYTTLCQTTYDAEASNSLAIGFQFGGGFDATPGRFFRSYGIEYGKGLLGNLDLSHTSVWTLGLNFGVGVGTSLNKCTTFLFPLPVTNDDKHA